MTTTEPSKRPKLIILDFDGTLGDTQSIIVRTMHQTLQELNLPDCTDQQCASTIGLPLKQCFTTLMPMTDEMGDRCAEVYTRIFFQNNRPGAVPPFPHVIETLEELHRQGHTLTIASSRGRDTLLDFVKSMGLSEIITYILSANDTTLAKPHPEPVLKTLEHFSCPPEDCLVVGDMTYDILMGRRASAKTCGVTYGNGTPADLIQAGADFLIDDFGQLPGILE
ncbi:MAG: HAD family hydrolase [Bacteroides sp.]|nr:HAD family hydrolase [Bacteroides sp.]